MCMLADFSCFMLLPYCEAVTFMSVCKQRVHWVVTRNIGMKQFHRITLMTKMN